MRYRGRLDRAAFSAWLQSSAGRDATAEIAAGIRFALLGRSRAARSRLWTQLRTAGESAQAAAAFNHSAEFHARALADLAFAPDLPRVMAGLRRVVLVPRALAVGRSRSHVERHLGAAAPLAALPDALRTFAIDQALREADAALVEAKPTPREPVAAANGWYCVGVDTSLNWLDEIWSGTGWQGHFVLYEKPPSMSRSDRKAVETAVASLQAGVQAFPRLRRQQVAESAARA